MFLLFAIVWAIFGSSEVQWWDTYWQSEKRQGYKKLTITNITRDDDNDSEDEQIPEQDFE